MQVRGERRVARSVAAGAAVAGAREPRRLRLQAQVVEGAVQLASDLVEQLLAGDQIVCNRRNRQIPQRTQTLSCALSSV